MSEGLHRIQDGRAVCLGDPTSKCHTYPDCECDFWDVDEITGKHHHPDVSNEECWVLPWINDVGLEDSAWDEAMDRRDPETLEFADGEIAYEWEGDYATWHYVDAEVAA